MASSTMINLRGITPLASSAAVLPGHALRFNIPGMPGVEPSSAAVEPITDMKNGEKDQVVHGVVYKLTEEDFATICQTEGVPFAYSLHRCRVIPYVGDGKTAGQDAMMRTRTNNEQSATTTTTMDEKLGVPAFTLRASNREWRKQGKDIPPSQSYLNVLIRGAKEFALDESHLCKLESLEVGNTWIGNGLAEGMLENAEKRRMKK